MPKKEDKDFSELASHKKQGRQEFLALIDMPKIKTQGSSASIALKNIH
jgi:hypothetical protein